MSDTWRIEGTSAHIEQGEPWHDHEISVERGMLIVDTMGPVGAAKLEVPLDVVRAVIAAYDGSPLMRAQERLRGAGDRHDWDACNEAEAEIESLSSRA